MISRFFIDRPIFAAVLSILITLAGAISVFILPLAQFPNISPPTVQVQCSYPGASAYEVSTAVAAPIEEKVNGVERMMYMSSQCANDGSYSLTVTFYPGIDLNMAQVLVQNRVNLAVPLLPEVIKQTGVSTRKRSPDILCGIALQSLDHRYDQLYLSNYALMQIKDELARVPGVGDVFLFGQRDYSMRVWLDPNELWSRGMTPADVVQALREQNQQVATGSIGQEPMPGKQEFQISLSTLGRLKDPEQFENVIVKTGKDGRQTRLKDIARVELGAKNSDIKVRLDSEDTVFLAIFQMPDANALDVRERVMAKIADLKKGFPEGITYDVGFDTTPYTSESIREVVITLRDAVILVAAVVLLFLQNWRSALIPLVAVPVAIIGTFAVMAVVGFSLNNLTLFGLVLAIGIVVDDAIVVVEAVEHHIEHGLAPREATIEAMRQVSGPVIAVGLVLSAVFVPCAFIGGITGAFFRQFALTISVSTVISAFNSLTLSPALTALLLKPRSKEGISAPMPMAAFPLIFGFLAFEFLTPLLERGLKLTPYADYAKALHSWSVPLAAAFLGVLVGWFGRRVFQYLLTHFFSGFNRMFSWMTRGYVKIVERFLRLAVIILVIYGGLLGLTYWAFQQTPKGFIPAQDMGILFGGVILPDAASLDRTDKVMKQVEKICLETPGVRHVSGLVGQSFVLSANGSNFGSLFINLKEYKDRRHPSLSGDAIANQLRMRFAKEVPDGIALVFPPPPVRGVGMAGGFKVMIEDRGDYGPFELQKQTENLIRLGNQNKSLMGMSTIFRANVPQYKIQPDLAACMMRGVNPQDYASALSIYEGSLYVNDFNLFGRTWQVIVQANQDFRRNPEDLSALRTRNAKGGMVPIGSLAETKQVNGPLVLNRYNMYPAAAINGMTAPGVSSGQVLDILRTLANDNLPQSMAYEWTDMSYLEQMAGNTAMIIFLCAVVMVFLVLAAQYESWSLPLAVILVVPMCLLSAIIGVNAAKMDINIFTQIGFVVLVGLACKNAILIVEFAKAQREEGVDRVHATLEACKVRLRPIIMTSLAFILGVVPLMTSLGAGAEMRRTLGTAVFSGMLGVTLFGIVLTPVFFYTIDRIGGTKIFSSMWMKRISTFGLDVLTMKPLRKAAKVAAHRLAGPHRNGQPKPKIEIRTHVNGKDGHANGKPGPEAEKIESFRGKGS